MKCKKYNKCPFGNREIYFDIGEKDFYEQNCINNGGLCPMSKYKKLEWKVRENIR